jgi:hypothetical protein
MANDEGIPKCPNLCRKAVRHSSFEIRHTFTIRHFPPPMKSLLRSRLFALILGVLVAFTACHGRRLTRANLDEVSQGMSRKQVESILGPPTSIDSTNLLVMKKVTYTYKQGNESVTIVFVNDEVASKESNLHD